MQPLKGLNAGKYHTMSRFSSTSSVDNIHNLQDFAQDNPSVKYLRLQWVDYTNTSRVRILPLSRARVMCEEGKFVGVSTAVLGLLQTDAIAPGFKAQGEYVYHTVHTQTKG